VLDTKLANGGAEGEEFGSSCGQRRNAGVFRRTFLPTMSVI
jgi:hypothetical protein